MSLLALCELSPTDPTNGGALRLWGLCSGGDARCIYLRERQGIEAGATAVEALKWVSAQQAELPEMQDRARKQQSSGNHVLVQGLDFAMRLADCGVKADVVDIVDSYSLYFQRRFDFLPLSHPLKKFNALLQSVRHRKRERRAARLPWTIVAASAADATRFTGGLARSVGLPNCSAWVELPILYVQRRDASCIGFHGTMRWEPNVSAAEYLVRHVFPHVRAQLPNARLSIFGGPIAARIDALSGLDGVDIRGGVDDIRAALADVDVYLMPMLQGSGVKNKLMEAMSAGLPVVTNRLGAEAFLDDIGSAVSVGESAQELAAHAVRLLSDGEARQIMSARSRAYAESHFSRQLLGRQLGEILETKRIA